MAEYNLDNYPFHDDTYRLIGIGMNIHRILGKGFLEIVYKDAFEYELRLNNIEYEREKEFKIFYKGVVLPHKFYADFVIQNSVILEIKSKTGLIEEHYAQVINYLAVSKLQVGLILNFNDHSLQYKRVVLTKK
jgi:GxxExxY protein